MSHQGRKHRLMEAQRYQRRMADRTKQPGFYKQEEIEKATKFLMQGSTIRQTCRIVQLNKTTICKLAKKLGISTWHPRKAPARPLAYSSAANGGSKFKGQFPVQPWEKSGICACGCGGKTTQAIYDDKASGVRAGGFYRFINGHQWKLRRTLFKPPDWKSSHDIQLERESVRRRMAEAAAEIAKSKEVVNYQDVREKLNGDAKLNGHDICNQQMGRMLNIARKCYYDLIVPVVIIPPKLRSKPVEPISEFYPYISRQLTSQEALLQLVNEAVPKGLPYRSDVCQEMLLALLSDEIKPEDVPKMVQIYIRKYNKMFSRHMLSLDAVGHGKEGDQTLYDLVAATNSGELYGIVKGGVNWRESDDDAFEREFDPMRNRVWDIAEDYL